MAKRFFFVCAGFLSLALAYHLGADRATAQTGARGQIRFVESRGAHVVVVSDTDEIFVIDPDKLRDVARGAGWAKFKLDAVK